MWQKFQKRIEWMVFFCIYRRIHQHVQWTESSFKSLSMAENPKLLFSNEFSITWSDSLLSTAFPNFAYSFSSFFLIWQIEHFSFVWCIVVLSFIFHHYSSIFRLEWIWFAGFVGDDFFFYNFCFFFFLYSIVNVIVAVIGPFVTLYPYIIHHTLYKFEADLYCVRLVKRKLHLRPQQQQMLIQKEWKKIGKNIQHWTIFKCISAWQATHRVEEASYT